MYKLDSNVDKELLAIISFYSNEQYTKRITDVLNADSSIVIQPYMLQMCNEYQKHQVTAYINCQII